MLPRKGSSIAALKPFTGASTTARRWPRPRSDTRCTPSPSVYVRYNSLRTQRPSLGAGCRNMYTIIWTTTPWTLPGVARGCLPSRLRLRCSGLCDDARCAGSTLWLPKLASQVAAACELGETSKLARSRAPRSTASPSSIRCSRSQHPGRSGHVRHCRHGYRRQCTPRPLTEPTTSYAGSVTTLIHLRVDAAGHIHVDREAWPLLPLRP